MQVQALAHVEQLLLRHLLDLVRDVARFDVRSERPSLDRLREDHRRRGVVVVGRAVRRVHLPVVVAASPELAEVVVRKLLDHLLQSRVGAEEVLADVRAGFRRVLLELAVDRRVQLVDEHAVDVLRQKLVPLAVPDHLDHVPARAAEHRFELLDDLAVPAHGPVQPLQVAVHDPDQVVEVFARGERDRAKRLRLIRLAIADEAPHLRVLGRRQSAVVQVPVEPRLVDARERPEPHRHGRERPQFGHEAGVRVRRQAVPTGLPPEVVQLLFGEPALQEAARIDARRRVPLVEDHVAGVVVGRAPEEVVEADLVQAGAGRVGR